MGHTAEYFRERRRLARVARGAPADGNLAQAESQANAAFWRATEREEIVRRGREMASMMRSPTACSVVDIEK